MKYRLEVDFLNRGSLHFEETHLVHLLEWADNRRFIQAPNIRPTFPEYILTAGKRSTNQLSSAYVHKAVSTARRFFGWAIQNKAGYGSILPGWLHTLKPPRMVEEPSEHEAVTLEYVRSLANAPVRTLREERVQAASVFWFLSGIRVGAFVTLPVKAVDIEALEVKQWPSLGVKTKFSKHATTFLLNIPDLLEVVSKWDRLLRLKLEPESNWFAPITPDTQEIDMKPGPLGRERHTRARKDLKDWVDRLGLPYLSPHKFRHGHAVYALQQSSTVADLKAVSLNLMHSDLKITDGIYAILSNNDVKERVTTLGKKNQLGNIDQVIELLNQLKQNH